jgi:phosphonate transport system substrate-binding protein
MFGHEKYIFRPERPIIIYLLAWVLICLAACSPDTNYKQVDLTEKIDSSKPAVSSSGRRTLRIAVAAMISPKETFIYYRELIDYLAAKSNHDVVLIQRKTYGEVNELLAKGQIDAAFICTGPYVVGNNAHGFKALATPIIRGKPFYQSYLIVHKGSPYQSLTDLRGKNFAFTDPESNSGTLVPRYWLSQMHARPESFFRTFTYTYSHDNSILAVAKKLVDAAAVDGHIWEFYQQRNDFYSKNTMVIKKSDPYGNPPLVVSDLLDATTRSSLTGIILGMHQDPQGSAILSELMIDRFVEPKAEWYQPVERMLKQLGQNGVTQHAAQ